MFIPSIEKQGTKEQRDKWLPLARSLQLIGTYAQTEMGHGSVSQKIIHECSDWNKTYIHEYTCTKIMIQIFVKRHFIHALYRTFSWIYFMLVHIRDLFNSVLNFKQIPSFQGNWRFLSVYRRNLHKGTGDHCYVRPDKPGVRSELSHHHLHEVLAGRL